MRARRRKLPSCSAPTGERGEPQRRIQVYLSRVPTLRVGTRRKQFYCHPRAHCAVLSRISNLPGLTSRITMSKYDIGAHRMADDAITRHFFNGFIRLHILYHAAKEPTYGAEITEELIRHGYRIGSGTLYPTFHLLENLGYLRSRVEVVQGRRRKY